MSRIPLRDNDLAAAFDAGAPACDTLVDRDRDRDRDPGHHDHPRRPTRADDLAEILAADQVRLVIHPATVRRHMY